jgi:hypothetical protein
MKLYNLKSVLTFGQHKGETVAEALKNNPTYLEWCYSEIDTFFITDSVWNALDVHRNLSEALKDSVTQEVLVINNLKDKNEKFHLEKRDLYKNHLIEVYEKKVEKELKGISIKIE